MNNYYKYITSIDNNKKFYIKCVQKTISYFKLQNTKAICNLLD